MSKEALELLREIEWDRLTGNRHTCRICHQYQEDEHAENCQLAKSISLLAAQPEPGECRAEKTGYCGYSQETMNAICKERDRLAQEFKQQQAEIERLRANPECPNCSYRKQALQGDKPD